MESVYTHIYILYYQRKRIRGQPKPERQLIFDSLRSLSLSRSRPVEILHPRTINALAAAAAAAAVAGDEFSLCSLLAAVV